MWLDAARYGVPGTARAAGRVLPDLAQLPRLASEGRPGIRCMHAPLERLTQARQLGMGGLRAAQRVRIMIASVSC